MSYIADRLKEPSSHAAIAAICTAAPSALAGNPLGILGVITGVIGFLFPEKQNPPA